MEKNLFYKELLNSELSDSNSAEKLIYERIFRKLIENAEVSATAQPTDKKQRIFSEILSGKSPKQASALYRRAVLESYNYGFVPEAALAYLFLQEPETTETKGSVKAILKELSNASSTMALPVISSTVRFNHNSENSDFLSVAVLSTKIKEFSAHAGRSVVYFVSFPHKETTETNAFGFKLLKEAMFEFSKLAEARTYYSAKDLATLSACFLRGTNFSGILDLKKIVDDASSMHSALCTSVANGFLLQIEEKNVGKALEICSKWQLNYVEVGEIIDNEPNILNYGSVNKLKIESRIVNSFIDSLNKSINIGELPQQVQLDELPEENSLIREAVSRMLERTNITSKRWIKEQFERYSGGNNLSTNFHTDTPHVLSADGKIINIVLQSLPHFYYKNPELGIKRSMLDLLRRITATGGTPTVCNICFLVPVGFHAFGYLKELAGQIATNLQIPCNVNFNILTGFNHQQLSWLPVISMIGKLGDDKIPCEYNFKHKGDMVFLLGETRDSLSEEYMQAHYQQHECVGTTFDFEHSNTLISCAKDLINCKLVNSVHAVSNNGLFSTIIEACVPGRFGVDITTDSELRTDVFWFGSQGGRFLVSVSPNKEDRFIDFITSKHIKFTTLGHVTKEELRLDDISYGFITDLRKKYLKNLAGKFK